MNWKDVLYLFVVSSVVSGLFTGGLLLGWWIYQSTNVWWAIFYVGFLITWMVEVNKE